MTAKITISISDDLKRIIDEYNNIHQFERLHISEIAQKAILDKILECDPAIIQKEIDRLLIEKEEEQKPQPRLSFLQKKMLEAQSRED